ncbi:hypothetical protein J1N35_011308 [Gossypium stocksii]|uniref:Uncharacterized protein n=1 Tax=Gossypium stocksii TaxID=47602 RepID=A0A9D3W3R7_9ROSI|nr:hypothetical protein J1N35_011308 [Gossypium stocksii]
MDEFDSGGRSGDKGPGAEDEGSTAPLPEKMGWFLGFWVGLCSFCSGPTRPLVFATRDSGPGFWGWENGHGFGVSAQLL